MRGGFVYCTLIEMSPWPPQLIWQHEVVMRTRLGISSFTNSACIMSIRLFTTPEASVPGMSQCSHPCVCEIIDTELPVPPTGKPSAISASTNGCTLSKALTMNSMLLRVVNRTCPSANRSPMSQSLRMVKTSIWRCVPARTVQTSSPPLAT